MIAVPESFTEEEHRLAGAVMAGHTVVVNVRRSGPHCRLVPWLAERELLTYVGNSGRWYDWPASPFANPFYRDARRDRAGAMAAYETWLAEQPQLLRWIAEGELTGRALGCWCAPLACHADVLARLADPQT